MSEQRPAPWRGRRRVEEPREKWTHVRWTEAEHQELAARAAEAGLSVGAYLRAVALGSAGPRAVKRLPVDRVMLAKVLGAIGHLGSNVNQLARVANSGGNIPAHDELALVAQTIDAMRAAVMKALGRGD